MIALSVLLRSGVPPLGSHGLLAFENRLKYFRFAQFTYVQRLERDFLKATYVGFYFLGYNFYLNNINTRREPSCANLKPDCDIPVTMRAKSLMVTDHGDWWRLTLTPPLLLIRHRHHKTNKRNPITQKRSQRIRASLVPTTRPIDKSQNEDHSSALHPPRRHRRWPLRSLAIWAFWNLQAETVSQPICLIDRWNITRWTSRTEETSLYINPPCCMYSKTPLHQSIPSVLTHVIYCFWPITRNST